MRFLVLQHAPYEGPGRYGQFAREARITLETVELWKPGYRLPGSDKYSEYDGAFVMGGSQGVNDPLEKYPSKSGEVKFLRDFHKPALCICLGSQLLADSRGARVYQGERKECGFYAIRLTPQGRRGIFSGLDDQIYVFHWHGDVFNVPDGAIPLAMSEYDQSIQAYSIDGKIATLFHLEMTPEMIGVLFDADGSREWFNNRTGFREHHGHTEYEVKRRAAELDHEMEQNARRVFDNFISVIKDQS